MSSDFSHMQAKTYYNFWLEIRYNKPDFVLF